MEFDSQSFVWSHILGQDMKMDLDKYSVGETTVEKAYGVAIPWENRTTILVAYDETGYGDGIYLTGHSLSSMNLYSKNIRIILSQK